MKTHNDTCKCFKCKVPEITRKGLMDAWRTGHIPTRNALIHIFGEDYFRPKTKPFQMGNKIEIEGDVFIIATTVQYCQAILINIETGASWGGIFNTEENDYINESELKDHIKRPFKRA